MAQTNTPLIDKSHIISLIKDDLKNTKLVSGLSELGLDSGKYYLNIGDVVFQLMGLNADKVDEKLWEDYSDSLNQVTLLNIFENSGKLDAMAESIYEKLLKEGKG
jgi:hypothetical protein